MQGLGIPDWWSRKLAYCGPWPTNVGSAAGAIGEEFNRETAISDEDEVQMAHALLYALWSLFQAEDLWHCLRAWGRRGFVPDSAGLGLLWMDCEWRLDSGWAAALDIVMDQGARAALAGHMARPTARHPMPAASLPGPDLLRPAGATRFRYHKLMLLVVEVETLLDMEVPSAFSVLRTIEDFANRSDRSWLKVAGDDKGYVLEACVRRRALLEGELAVEFGSFVGYTTVRLGELHRRSRPSDGGGAGGPCVLSLEREAVHASVARHLLDLSRLRCIAEVHVGLLPLVSPHGAEEFGAGGLGFSFMDHKGTRFHDDTAELASLKLPAAGAQLLADNALNPGAPELLWRLSRGGLPFTCEIHSLCEFAHSPPVEDWQCLSDAVGQPLGPLLHWDPSSSSRRGERTWAGSAKTIFEREPWTQDDRDAAEAVVVVEG